MVEFTMPCLLPFEIMGRICLKSPSNTTIFSPKGSCKLFGLEKFKISLRDLSKASKEYLCIIRALSQIINLVTVKSSAIGLPCLMLQVESSLIIKGIPNLKCAILPPGRSKDAIPLEATVRTISLFYHKAVAKVR